MLPNFVIIGAARCGTTTIYNQLQTHPDIYLPTNKRPEPHFFYKSVEYAKGISYYEDKYFSAWNGQRCVGEASTSYLFGPNTPELIRQNLGDVKLICILRNPIERAISSYFYTRENGLETLSFDEAIRLEGVRKKELEGTYLGEIAPYAYAERGFYHTQLKRWFKVFDRALMKIIIFDDLVTTPNLVLADIALFLGISEEHLKNREVKAENRSSPIGNDVSPSTKKILKNIFYDEVMALSKLIERDLTHWLV